MWVFKSGICRKLWPQYMLKLLEVDLNLMRNRPLILIGLQFFNENHVNEIIIQQLNHYDLNTRLFGFFRESLSFIHTNVKREQISNIQNVPIVLRICVHIILIMFLEANFWNFCISWILSPINFFFVLKTLTSSYLLNSINVDNME